MIQPSLSPRGMQREYLLEFAEQVLLKLIWRLPVFFLYYDRFFILSYDFDTPAPCVRRLKSIRTRVAERSDIPALNRFLENGARYENRFARGDMAVVAEIGDEVVGMEWIEAGRGPLLEHYEEENEYRFLLPEGSAWTYDGHVSPSYRVKGVWASIADEVMQLLRRKAFHSVCCMVKGFNRHAMNTHLRYGYRPIRQVIFIRFLFLRIYFEKKPDGLARKNAWRFTFAIRKLRCYRGSLKN